MHNTEKQSGVLKRQFKEHFQRKGYEAPLTSGLDILAECWPVEFAEACEEWERFPELRKAYD